MGTAVHAAIQEYLGAAGILYGSWRCRRCDRKWFDQLGPGLCCEELPEYIEYSFVHPTSEQLGEYGHTDGIVPLPAGAGYFIIEIKTTGGWAVKQLLRMKWIYPKHKSQGAVYHQAFAKGHARVRMRKEPNTKYPTGKLTDDREANLPPGGPQGVLFIYVHRDKPRPKNWMYLWLNPEKAQRKGDVLFEELEREAELLPRYVKDGIIPEGTCRVEEDATDEWRSVCPWAKLICFSDHGDAMLKQFSDTARAHKKTKPH